MIYTDYFHLFVIYICEAGPLSKGHIKGENGVKNGITGNGKNLNRALDKKFPGKY